MVFLILQLGQEEGMGLEKICFAPLTSAFTGPTQLSQCVVQSIWGYFQNNNNASFSDLSYLDHFMKCSQ